MGLKQRYEEYEKIQQKKRLELYEATFNAELEEYKRKRETEISSLYPSYVTYIILFLIYNSYKI